MLKYQRVCKRCNHIYRTNYRYSDICYNCHKGCGSNKEKVKSKKNYEFNTRYINFNKFPNRIVFNEKKKIKKPEFIVKSKERTCPKCGRLKD